MIGMDLVDNYVGERRSEEIGWVDVGRYDRDAMAKNWHHIFDAELCTLQKTYNASETTPREPKGN